MKKLLKLLMLLPLCLFLFGCSSIQSTVKDTVAKPITDVVTSPSISNVEQLIVQVTEQCKITPPNKDNILKSSSTELAAYTITLLADLKKCNDKIANSNANNLDVISGQLPKTEILIDNVKKPSTLPNNSNTELLSTDVIHDETTPDKPLVPTNEPKDVIIDETVPVINTPSTESIIDETKK